MREQFGDDARRVLLHARKEAALLNHSFIGTEHILLGLIHEDGGVASQVLASCAVTTEAVRRYVEETIGPAEVPPTSAPPYAPRATKVIQLARGEALRVGQDYVDTEHVLLGILSEGNCVAVQVLVNLGVELATLRGRVIELSPFSG